MTAIPSISVVVPSYNRCESILTLLFDIFRQKGVTYEVIVVDDCSRDGSADAIAREFPMVNLIRNETNGGPCVARNRGIRAARAEIVVGFDSDVTVPDTHLLAKVERAFVRNPGITGFAFRLLAPDGCSDDAPRWWHSPPIERFAGRIFETSYFSGTGYALLRSEMIAAGAFPEILYMHYEEVWLAWRILDAGGRIVYCPEFAVLHHEHRVSRRNEIKCFYKVRNQFFLAVCCLLVPVAFRYIVPRVFYQMMVAIRHNHVSAFFNALREVFNRWPDLMRERAAMKRETLRRLCAIHNSVDLILN